MGQYQALLWGTLDGRPGVVRLGGNLWDEFSHKLTPRFLNLEGRAWLLHALSPEATVAPEP